MQRETTLEKLDKRIQENKKESQVHPLQQWDQLAFTLIYNELAKNGFKKVTSGGYRGLEIAKTNEPGLPKQRVTTCQRIAAQLVRDYRNKAKSLMKHQIETMKRELSRSKWYQFRKKIEFKAAIEVVEEQIKQLDIIGTK